jgi:hypothetical protein
MNERFDDIITDARRKKRRELIYKTVFITLLAVAAIASYLYRTAVEKTIALEEKVEEAYAAVYEKEKALEERDGLLRDVRMVQRYATYLPITMNVQKMPGALTVSGTIRNKGRFEADNIELLISLLDRANRSIYEETFVASSMDGEPLKRGQRRYFNHTVTNPPSEATDVVVIVNGIDFVGGKPWE